MTTDWKVGSLARVTHQQVTRRVVVAVLHDDDHIDTAPPTATVLWEQAYPPVSSRWGTDSTRHAPQQQQQEEEEVEWHVPLDQLRPLETFEQPQQSSSDSNADNDTTPTPSTYKAWGDALLKLGDAPAAVPYYERALQQQQLEHKDGPSIGSTIVARRRQQRGEPFGVAEVDCVDAADGSLDVCWINTSGDGPQEEEEATLPVTDHVLTLPPDNDHDYLPVRILLNLVRCWLQIAQTAESSFANVPSHKTRYAQAAVGTATVALVVTRYYQQQQQPTAPVTHTATALALRAHAYQLGHQWPAAAADWTRLLQECHNRNHSVVVTDRVRQTAVRQLAYNRQQQRRAATREKKLVKEFCRWVDAAQQGPPPAASHGTTTTSRRSKYEKDPAL